ncbi:hypothetical protein MSHO_39000 [Mycobacterium shottsii]|uniref:Uncharacterized protein n=1 Tax=Mycobacterium shottsii TaxID=133549 RepID=A0A7I7LFF0_9MYCO|nr:hypothetical protein MSHO_39000 [Mycobacterium shottsii]
MTDTPAPPLFARGPKGNKLKVQPIVPQLSNTAAEGVVSKGLAKGPLAPSRGQSSVSRVWHPATR